MENPIPLSPLTIGLSGISVLTKGLFSHYAKKLRRTPTDGTGRDGLLYDQTFTTVRNFFAQIGFHTVEELQRVGNAVLPSPPWIKVVKVSIPATTLSSAAKTIIDTLGKEELDKVAGGTEWWQRREVAVQGEWITTNKLAKKGKDETKLSEEAESNQWRERAEGLEDSGVDLGEPEKKESPTNNSAYSSELDAIRCILFIHGGAYFFGSINTHRHAIWRLARKTGGRAFAVEYRLAPLFPFPCALQDALAAYLYLIRPPPDAAHLPIDPAKITIAGDSAGGGLTLALLALIRDAGLPAPAGAVLISPWVDLTHSFPSILQNTRTDFIPPYGFMFKPSTIWPPPTAAFSTRAKNIIRSATLGNIAIPKKKGSRFGKKKGKELANATEETGDPQEAENVGGDADFAQPAAVMSILIDGEVVEIDEQIQLYATNEQLVHRFVSPIWQPSLGNLPPLYILAGDHEVLRDEIIYLAHRAAHPDKYPLRQGLLDANPEKVRLAAAQHRPTQVHLQVYDQVPHDLLLLNFAKPSKFAFRAMSAFIVNVTTSPSSADDPNPIDTSPPTPISATPTTPTDPRNFLLRNPSEISTSDAGSVGGTLRRALTFTSSPTDSAPPLPKQLKNIDQTIYSNLRPFDGPQYVDNMRRERVSWDGVIRPLESEQELSALALDKDNLGMVGSSAVSRYLAGKAIWDQRFSRTGKNVRKVRERILRKTVDKFAKLSIGRSTLASIDKRVSLDSAGQENPPPSSLAARTDIPRGQKLATF